MRLGFALARASLAVAAAFALLAAAFASAQTETTSGAGVVVRIDKRLDALVPAGAVIEKVADGFVFQLHGPEFSAHEGHGLLPWLPCSLERHEKVLQRVLADLGAKCVARL